MGVGEAAIRPWVVPLPGRCLVSTHTACTPAHPPLQAQKGAGGREHLSKAEVMRLAQASTLANKPIYGEGERRMLHTLLLPPLLLGLSALLLPHLLASAGTGVTLLLEVLLDAPSRQVPLSCFRFAACTHCAPQHSTGCPPQATRRRVRSSPATTTTAGAASTSSW